MEAISIKKKKSKAKEMIEIKIWKKLKINFFHQYNVIWKFISNIAS